MDNKSIKYTCAEYREEMILLSLKMRLNDKKISDKEKKIINREIARIESAIYNT